MSNIITKKIFYVLGLELTSPINVSSGRNDLTDCDLLKRKDDEYFIPGTSMAGAIRNRMQDQKDEMMGYTDDESGKMSSVFVSDLVLNDVKTSVRDGVKLDDGKMVDNKFDLEIVEPGAKGYLRIKYIVRENDQENDLLINRIISDIEEGYIRIGSNKNRGFGRMKVNNVYRKEFKKTDLNSFLEFDPLDISEYDKLNKDSVICNNKSDDYVKIQIPLKLTGGISIRKYSAKPNEADYEQVTIAVKDSDGNNKPVVPGTSWNGAIRADVKSVLRDLGDSEATKHIDAWFGSIDGDNASQSLVVIGESVIEGSVPLKMTRNKINRFDASTVGGALYTEKSYFGGFTTLEIMVRKNPQYHYEALIGALQIAIKDIQNGYVAIGGQTAVGRGIFAVDDSRDVIYGNAGDVSQYAKALFCFLKEER